MLTRLNPRGARFFEECLALGRGPTVYFTDEVGEGAFRDLDSAWRTITPAHGSQFEDGFPYVTTE